MNAGLGRPRRLRRFSGAVAALVLGAGFASVTLGAGSASADVAPHQLSAGIPSGPVETGATFYTDDVTFNLPENATVTSVVLSSTPDGSGQVVVDDRAVLTVNNGAPQTFNFYTDGCGEPAPGTPALAGVTAGENQVHLEYQDVCGVGSGATPVYAVVTYTVPDPEPEPLRKTWIEAESLVADVAGDGDLLDVNLPEVSAQLFTKAPSSAALHEDDDDDGDDHDDDQLVPLANKMVIFTNGGDFICKDLTDERGVARCFGLDKTLEGLLSYRATFLGDDGFRPSSDEASILTLLNLSVLPVR